MTINYCFRPHKQYPNFTMTAIHETAYSRLKPNPDEPELKQNFFPTNEEIELLNKNTSEKSPHSQLGFMLSL